MRAPSGRLDGGADPFRRRGSGAGAAVRASTSGVGVWWFGTLQADRQDSGSRSESHDHGHLDHSRGRAGRHDATDPRLDLCGQPRPELPDAPPRLLAGPGPDLTRGPRPGQRLGQNLGELAGPRAGRSRPASRQVRPGWRGRPVPRGPFRRLSPRGRRELRARHALRARPAPRRCLRPPGLPGRLTRPRLTPPAARAGLREDVVIGRRRVRDPEQPDRGRVRERPLLRGPAHEAGNQRQDRTGIRAARLSC